MLNDFFNLFKQLFYISLQIYLKAYINLGHNSFPHVALCLKLVLWLITAGPLLPRFSTTHVMDSDGETDEDRHTHKQDYTEGGLGV